MGIDNENFLNSSVPFLSVLMTAYNREKYITVAIQSVLASSYTDIELIIVDDGSTDKTVEIARSFALADNRLRVYINEKNLGDYPNRNQAASYARGKYIKYVDSDDYIYPWALEIMVGMMEKFPEAGFGFCTMTPDKSRIFPFALSPKDAYEYHYLGPGLFMRAPLSAIIKMDAFNTVGGFKPIRMAGDFEMWHRLAQQFPVVLMPQGMIWYRSHDAQEMNDYSAFATTYEEITASYLNSESFPLGKGIADSIRHSERKKILMSAFKQFLKFNFKKAGIYFRNLRIYKSPKT